MIRADVLIKSFGGNCVTRADVLIKSFEGSEVKVVASTRNKPRGQQFYEIDDKIELAIMPQDIVGSKMKWAISLNPYVNDNKILDASAKTAAAFAKKSNLVAGFKIFIFDENVFVAQRLINLLKKYTGFKIQPPVNEETWSVIELLAQ